MVSLALSSFLWMASSFRSHGFEQSRMLQLANQDASRVMDQLTKLNAGRNCFQPSTKPPAGFGSWDIWLASRTGGGGKTVQAHPATHELVVVSEASTGFPRPVIVAVCVRQDGKTTGECKWDGTSLLPDPSAGGDPLVTESPAMLTSNFACKAK
jgi:hypothetical protein